MKGVLVILLVSILTGDDVVNCQRMSCPRFEFTKPSSCQLYPDLCCEDIEDLTVVDWIARGTVKNVYLADWDGYRVVLSNLTNEAFKEDFEHNVAMHLLLDYGRHTVRMLGHCGGQIVTEFHRRGNLLQAIATLEDVLEVRFPLCIRYVSILAFLHRHDRVMCDSNTLEKTLEQYLLTEDGRLLLNDLDALPKKESGVVRCGRRMLDGDFVAPEQRGELGYRRGYDEKTDVYKIPDVCEYLLGENEHSLWFRYWLFDVHKACKLDDASERPTAADVLAKYRELWKDYQTDTGIDYDDL